MIGLCKPTQNIFFKSRAVWKLTKKPLLRLEYGKLPDPVAEAVRLVFGGQEKLGGRLKRLESLSGLIIPKDELRDKKRELVREFNQGEGI